MWSRSGAAPSPTPAGRCCSSAASPPLSVLENEPRHQPTLPSPSLGRVGQFPAERVSFHPLAEEFLGEREQESSELPPCLLAARQCACFQGRGAREPVAQKPLCLTLPRCGIQDAVCRTGLSPSVVRGSQAAAGEPQRVLSRLFPPPQKKKPHRHRTSHPQPFKTEAGTCILAAEKHLCARRPLPAGPRRHLQRC